MASRDGSGPGDGGRKAGSPGRARLAPGSEPRQTSLRDALVLFALVLAAYATALPNAYTQDDHAAIEGNRLVREPGHLREIFSTNYWWGFGGQRGSLYRPLTVLSHAWVWRSLGPSPFAAHLVNLVLHFSVCLALMGSLGRIPGGGPLALPAAALFALHPIHTEAVASAVGRAELLAALFVLLSLRFHLGASGDSEGWRGAARLAAMAAAAALGMLSKEVALPVVVLPLLADAARPDARRRIGRGILGAYPVMLLAAAAYFFARWKVIGGIGTVTGVPPSDNPLVELHGVEWLAATLGVAVRQARVLVFPVRLSAEYSLGSFPLSRSLAGAYPLAAVALAALLVAGLAVSRLKAPAVFLFLAGSCLFFLPASNLVFPIRTLLAERTLYLPSVGLCVLLAWCLKSLGRTRGRVLLVLLGIVFLARTAGRNLDWRGDFALFRSIVREYPGNFRAQAGLGQALLEAGRPNDALGHFQRSIEANPRNQPSFAGAANALAALGMRGEAIRVLGTGAALHPGFAPLQYELGLMLLEEGRAEEALAAFDRVLEIQHGRSHLASAGRIRAFMVLGRWDEAEKAFESEPLPEAGPGDLRRWRADCALALGREDEALDRYRSAIEIEPADGAAWAGQGKALAALSRPAEAQAAFARALSADARAPGALNGLALIKLK